METVELLVYVTMSVIVGSLFIYFLGSYDNAQVYEHVTDMFKSDGEGFDEVDVDGFAQRSYNVWQDCRFGQREGNATLYVTGENLNKSVLFQRYKKINLCDSISSATYNCGEGEDVTFTNGAKPLPSVARVTCNSSGLYIS